MIPLRTAARAAASTRGRLLIRAARSCWSRGVIVLLTCLVLAGAATVGSALVTLAVLYHVYFDRENLPDLGPFTRFEFPTIGHIYDVNGERSSNSRESTGRLRRTRTSHRSCVTQSWPPKTSISSRITASTTSAFHV
jgi:hypothetical protein